MKTFRACGIAVAAFFSLCTLLAVQTVGGGAAQTTRQTTTSGYPPTQSTPPEKQPETRNVLMPNGEFMPVTGPVRPSRMRFTDEEILPVDLKKFGYEFFLPARYVIDTMRFGNVALSVPTMVDQQQDALNSIQNGVDPATGQIIDPLTGKPIPGTGGGATTAGGPTTGGQAGKTGQTTGQTTGGVNTGGQTTGLSAGSQTTGTQTTGLSAGAQTTGQTNGQTTGQTNGAQTTGQATGGQTNGLSTGGQTTGLNNGGQTNGQTTGQTTGQMTTNGQTTGLPPTGQGGPPRDPRTPLGANGQPPLPGNAFTNAIGPLNLTGLMATPPENYQLGPGDTLSIRVWSPTMELQEFEVRIDQNGAINAPGTQKRVILRGLTLADARLVLLREAKSAYRDADMTVQLNELRTFSVSILGESYAPGTYQVPATFSVFNLLYITGGPTDIGSLRDIQLKRVNGETKHFDFYKMIRGDGSQDAMLNAGDTIVIPPARITVSVKGQVVRPALYEMLPGEHLQDAIKYAEGTRATGVQQNISVDSIVPGVGRRLINSDLGTPGGDNNPPLYDGDVVEVFSVRPDVNNAVAVMGAVDQPRVFALKDGMTVRDLITSARGLLPDASTRSADLYRLNPDESYALTKINLDKVLAGDASQNLVLRPDDVLRIYRLSEVEFLQERVVYLEGAVRAPGRYYRADNMRVSDLVISAGGLAPDASMESAFLQRVNPDGTYGELVTVDLLKAQAGNPDHDVLLANRDILRVLTTLDARPTPDQMVEIAGAIQRPGLYPLASNMHIVDLVRLAGMPNFDAYQDQVFVQRFNLDGTIGPLETVNLAAALKGDQAENVVLKPKDKVSIYTLNQVQQRQEQIVTVLGAVQNPGSFPRSSDMSLADAIRLAGGLKLNVSNSAEIARSGVPFGTPIEKIDISQAVATKNLSSLEGIMISDGDIVTIPADSDYLVKPLIVSITGQVKYPGNYVVNDRNVRLKDLIDRAGGLTASAWEQGGQFSRNPKLLSSQIQRDVTPRIQELFRIIQEDEYRRAIAQAELEKAKILAQAGTAVQETYSLYQMVGIPVPPYVQPKAVPPASAGKEQGIMLVNSLATKARPPSRFENVQGGNMYIDFKQTMRGGDNPDNIILKDGDVIFIPETPSTVFLDGPGVTFNQGVVYRPGRKLSFYISQAGGLTIDAAKDQILVIRPSGVLTKPNMNTVIEAGDLIFVPTKVMVTRITNGKSTWDSIFQGLTSAALIYGLLSK